jgi:hypothetical protein
MSKYARPYIIIQFKTKASQSQLHIYYRVHVILWSTLTWIPWVASEQKKRDIPQYSWSSWECHSLHHGSS